MTDTHRRIHGEREEANRAMEDEYWDFVYQEARDEDFSPDEQERFALLSLDLDIGPEEREADVTMVRQRLVDAGNRAAMQTVRDDSQSTEKAITARKDKYGADLRTLKTAFDNDLAALDAKLRGLIEADGEAIRAEDRLRDSFPKMAARRPFLKALLTREKELCARLFPLTEKINELAREMSPGAYTSDGRFPLTANMLAGSKQHLAKAGGKTSDGQRKAWESEVRGLQAKYDQIEATCKKLKAEHAAITAELTKISHAKLEA
ncbi:MAG: hypothetical protein IAF94_12620 [Pirellulaceae bacterium]|nr:hypothetical protein [Pirellulaceae bacterium]